MITKGAGNYVREPSRRAKRKRARIFSTPMARKDARPFSFCAFLELLGGVTPRYRCVIETVDDWRGSLAEKGEDLLSIVDALQDTKEYERNPDYEGYSELSPKQFQDRKYVK